MAAVFDTAELKQRVAATQSKLSAAAQDERERNAHLLEVLEAAERTLTDNQQHIRSLEDRQGRTLEEFQQLRNLLHDMQTGPPRLLWRCFFPKPLAAQADLVGRLDATIDMMNQDGEEGIERGRAKGADIALVRILSGKFLDVLSFIGLLAAVGLAAYKINSSMPLHLVTPKCADLRE